MIRGAMEEGILGKRAKGCSGRRKEMEERYVYEEFKEGIEGF